MSIKGPMTTRILLGAFAVLTVFAGPQNASAEKFFDLFNYPSLDWYVIHTEHFNVFYPVSKKGPEETRFYLDGNAAARKTALVCEEMYEPICSQYDLFLEETVNVVILEQPDDLWGYTIPNFDWIVVSSKHDDMLWRWRGHADWLRAVIYHEYAHVVSLKKDGVFAENSFGWVVNARWRDGAYNTDTGINVFIGDGDPWWWVEGGAEYTSEVAGINTWNSNRDMWMRADILEGTLLAKSDWEDYYGRDSWMDGERHYNSGYNFAVYLDEQYGEGIYQAFAKNKEESGWTANFDRVVEDTLGVTVEELRDGWIEWATAKYTKVQDEVMAEPAIGAEMRYTPPDWELPEDDEDRIEWEKKKEFEKLKDYESSGSMRWCPRYTADGRYMADYEYRGGRLTVTEIDEEMWMPMRRAYLDEEEDEELISDLKKRKVRTGWKKGTVPSASGSGQFDWSPDGTRLVSQCYEHDISKAQHDLKMYTYPGGYTWNTLCITEVVENEDDESLEMELVGKLKGALRVQDPSWSPDGEWIAYTEYAAGNQNLFKIRADDFSLEGESRVQLTPFLEHNTIEMVDWSPDGTQLVFGLWRNNMQDLWIVNADGTDPHPITRDRYEDRDPYWADDGMIYFSSDRVGGIYNVFRFNPNAEIGWRDTDGDSFADSEDNCPEEPETFNRWRDQDGCPDELPVRVTAERVEISEKIFFDLGTANLSAQSNELLDVLAETLNRHPGLTSIEVAGHTDSQGKKRANQELSQNRAQAVVAYLAGKEVDAARLTPKGYGQTKLLSTEDTEEAHALNRRVEFVILARDEAVAAQDRPMVAGKGGDDAFTPPELPEEMPETLLIVKEYTPEIIGKKATQQELDNAALIQVTNVLYGAFTPGITPKGNLMYSYYTCYGWKLYGLNKDDFYNHVVDDTALAFGDDEWDLELQEDIPSYAEVTEPVPTGGKYLRPPGAIPILSLENNSRSHMAFAGGIYMWGNDFLSNHDTWLYATFGEYMVIAGGVTLNKLAPNISFGGQYVQYKYDFAYRWDRDEDSATTDDIFQGDIKGGQAFYGAYAGIDIPLNSYLELSYNNFTYGASSTGTDEGTGVSPIFFHVNNTFHFGIASFSEQAMYWGNFAINPRGGIRVSADVSVNYSDILYESTHGVDADDGELFDRYVYPEFQFQTIGYIAVPWAKRFEHTLQLDLLLGLIPMNVPYSDEFRGGGQSALGYRNPWTANTSFAGYEPWSLSGEMMGVFNAAYRLPIARNIDKKFGILYLESIYLQIFSTWGNFWSYHVREGAETYQFVYGDEVAYNANDIVPETLFSDRLDNCPTDVKLRNGGECGRALFPVASQNGNRILGDIGVELRIRANLFNRSSWNSFIRVAYGFQEIGGIWDVDGDDIVTNVSDPNVGSISTEKEKPSIRLYIGLGTGW